VGAHGDAGLPGRGRPTHRHAAAAAFPTLYEPAVSLITALRVVCGGSVVATRYMLGQADDEFPLVPGVMVDMPAFDTADNERPTVLYGSELDTFYVTYTALNLPAVQADRSLQVAIRRLVYAGSRRAAGDRLIDLTISAEALFIKARTFVTDQDRQDRRCPRRRCWVGTRISTPMQIRCMRS
jgi:hypothetical protein